MPYFMKLNTNSLYEFHMVIRGGQEAHHLTCVFAAMHLQMRQLEVPLAATRISTYEWTLFVGLWWPDSWWSNTRNPSNILKGEAEGEDRGLYSREVHFSIFIYRTSVNVVASVCVCCVLCACMCIYSDWPAFLWRRCVCVCGTGHWRARVEVGLRGHCHSRLHIHCWARATLQMN